MKDKKKFTYGLLIISFLTLIIFPAFAAAQFSHPGDTDQPTLKESLIGTEIIWQVINASGIYYSGGEIDDSIYRVGSFIKYDVLGLDYEDQVYDVDISVKYFAGNEFVNLGQNKSDFLLISRAWGDNMVKYIVEENAAFWGDPNQIDQAYDSEFTTTWWEFNLINTYTVRFQMNETDYEELVYTRAEGILISRTAVVGGGQGGYLRIELVSYSGTLELSPWFYLIIGGSIFGILILVLVIGSYESQRKKLMRIREEEIKGRSYLGAIVGGLLVVYGFMNLINFTSVQISATQTTMYYMLNPPEFMIAFCGILLIILMSIKEDKYRYSGIAIGIGVTVFGLLIIFDYLIVSGQVAMTQYFETEQVYFTLFGYIPGWIPDFMFPVGIVLFILGIFIITTLSLKEGRDSIFIKAACPIIILVGIFCLVDYLLNIISNFEIDLTPFSIWSYSVSSLLAVGCIFIIPLVSFLAYTKKR